MKIYITGILVLLLWISCYNQKPQSNNEFTNITILETSDVHGNIYNWDFFGEKIYDQGFAQVSTVVKQERTKDKNLLLLDNGDTIQGTPLIYYYNIMRPDTLNPIALVMNKMRYDCMTIGNHEYNYGQTVLSKFIGECHFPVMSANVKLKSNGARPYPAYFIKTVRGIKVGIVSLTTPGVPIWEKPENIEGLLFEDAVITAKEVVSELKDKGVQVIIALAHTGTHLEPENSRDADAWLQDYHSWVDKGYAAHADQNFALLLAEQVPNIDVILAGHAHSTIPYAMVNNVLITEPYKWGRGVSKVTITVDRRGKVVNKSSEYISVSGFAPDAEILELAQPYQETALNYVNSVIGTATAEFPGGVSARTSDGPLADFINAVQMSIAETAGYKADISLAAVFNNKGMLKKGQIKISDVYGIYQFDNTLNVIEISGADLLQALEHDAEYWSQSTARESKALTPSGLVRDYNWDMYAGIEYQIDISKPIGQRIVKLTYHGRDVRRDQKFKLAVNNYRAGGGGGYEMFRNAPVIWKSMTEIRTSMIDYIREKEILDPKDYYDHNWDIIR